MDSETCSASKRIFLYANGIILRVVLNYTKYFGINCINKIGDLLLLVISENQFYKTELYISPNRDTYFLIISGIHLLSDLKGIILNLARDNIKVIDYGGFKFLHFIFILGRSGTVAFNQEGYRLSPKSLANFFAGDLSKVI